ncbi:unnamed protein product [Caenorhabditis auriculariae]|uniref:Uncharacterized protein n=1 Tax=Caenorhabditis auriculariae TaxID=2777116 RepID=A0A8S1HDD1_9PELO|nr:unnamed protein product [Caenorhabditis auriculariae]
MLRDVRSLIRVTKDYHYSLQIHMQKYEFYRIYLQNAVTSLLIAAGCDIDFKTENRRNENFGNILQMSMNKKFEPRKVNETMAQVLLSDLTLLKNTTWNVCRRVSGEESLLGTMKTLLERAAKQDREFQEQLLTLFDPIFDFLFSNPYDKMRETIETLADKATDLEGVDENDTKKYGAYLKAREKYFNARANLLKIIQPGERRPFDLMQRFHLSILEQFFRNYQDYNKRVAATFASLNNISKSDDSAGKKIEKNLRIEKIEARMKAVNDRES